jgi:hypothetical protein
MLGAVIFELLALKETFVRHSYYSDGCKATEPVPDVALALPGLDIPH